MIEDSIEKVITIKSSQHKTSKTGKPYLEVIDQDANKFSCWDEGLWNSLGQNASGKIQYQQKGIFKNIIGIEVMEQAIAGKAIEAQPKNHEPQEIGMWWKECGEMIRAGKITKATDVGGVLYRAYFAKMLDVLGVKVERKED